MPLNRNLERKHPDLVLVLHSHSWLALWIHKSLSRDFHVSSFAESQDALAYARSATSVDVLVTDLDLARSAVGGCSLARDVRRRFPNCLVVIFDNSSSQDHRLGLLENMPNLIVLKKPFGAFSLRRVVLKALTSFREDAQFFVKQRS